MCHARHGPFKRTGLVGSVVLVGLALAGVGRAQVPQVGDIQKLKVITIVMQVGSMEKETRTVTYSPPPGWYVRSHVINCLKRSGNASFSATTVPQNWTWLSEEKITESYNLLIELAAKLNNAALQARCVHERDAMLTELRKVHATRHALVVEAQVRGEGLWGRGELHLVVTADLVFIGTDQEPSRPLDRQQPEVK